MNSTNHKNDGPPRWAERLLFWFHPAETLEEVQGDLDELYTYWYERAGKTQAILRYVLNVVSVLPPFVRRRQSTNQYAQPFSLKPAMIRNYLTVARRNLARHKSYTLINVLGLALGMTCGILIFSLVTYHLSFDTFHTKADRIYRLTTELHDDKVQKLDAVPEPMGQAVRQDFGVAEKVARVVTFGTLITLPSSKGNPKFQESDGVAYAESDFFDIMDFPLVAGDKKTALVEPHTALITQRLATKYFGTQDAIGQTFRLDNKTDFKITGILKDIPTTTDRRQEIYLSYPTLKETNSWLTTWGGIANGSNCYMLLKEGVSPTTLEKAFAALSKKYYNARDAQKFQFKAQPLSDVHFNPELGGYVAKSQLLGLALIGLFLIITACVNFINLATAQALGRSKEIGIRKVMGSIKAQLFWQFITETALITGVALLIALGLAYVLLPYLNQLLNTPLTLNLLGDYRTLVFLLGLLTIVVFASGSYPGLILAGFQPILALKGKVSQKQAGGFSVRRGLVVAQFAISQALLIGTIVITSQLQYASKADMGFNKDAIVMLNVPDNSQTKISGLNARLSSIAGVEKVAFCNAAPASLYNNFDTGIQYDSRTEAEKFTIFFKVGDANYLSTFGLKLLAGRNLTPSDTIREYLLNETAVKRLRVKSPQDVLGKNTTINGKIGTIVGVVKDFHNGTFRSAIEPVCLTMKRDSYFNCAVKVNPKNLTATLSSIEKSWSAVYPADIYSYQFVDEHIAKFYETDNLILQLIRFFSAIAIFIGCLGLYGLVSFMASQKTKEIGVRKTLGANIGQIVWLFGKEFAQLLLIAFVIAAPIGWWAMNRYLSDFQYRIELDAGIFLLAIGITFLIAILTVGYRSMKAALMNPVKSLRSE